MAKFRSHLSRVTATLAPVPVGAGAGRSAPWGALALFLLLLGGAAPALSDPAQNNPAQNDPAKPSETATACWTPGTAPDLFAWSDAPGIACRDSAETSGSADRPGAAQSAQRPLQAAGSSQSDIEITFSGSAYAGIAASF